MGLLFHFGIPGVQNRLWHPTSSQEMFNALVKSERENWVENVHAAVDRRPTSLFSSYTSMVTSTVPGAKDSEVTKIDTAIALRAFSS